MKNDEFVNRFKILKIFISRDLKPTSPFKKELVALDMEIIGQSLIEFYPTPFNTIPVVDWIFFYSKNGVKFFLETFTADNFLRVMAAKNRPIQWAVMGKGTAATLEKHQIQPDFIGTGHPKATAKAFGEIAHQQKVLFPRAEISKQSVQNLLIGQIEIFDLIVYANKLKPTFFIPYCDILVFTSPLNVVAYFQKHPIQSKQKVVAIGKTTANALEKKGLQNIIVASQPSEKGLAATVTEIVLKIKNS